MFMPSRCTALHAGELRDAATAVARDESVKGILILVTDGGAAVVDDALPELRDLPATAFGGVFPTLVHEGETVNEGALVIGLSTRPTVTEVAGLSDRSVDLQAQLDPTLLDGDHETAFVFVDSYADRIGDFIKTLFDTYGVELNFIGGGTGTLDDGKRPSLFTESGVLSDAAVIATVPMSSTIGVKHGWTEVDGPFRVTGADGTTLKSLDGQPAFEIYEDVLAEEASLDVDPDDFFETAKAYPFGISRMSAEPIVRDPHEVGEDGSVECFGEIPEGEYVHILHGDEQQLVNAAQAAATAAVGNDSSDDGHSAMGRSTDHGESLFTFDCISRVLYLGDKFERELAVIGGDERNPTGALTIGEIANDGHGHLEYYNKTTVVASLFEE
jgi:hypothetical protein